MIYLTSTTESQQILIPNTYGFTPGAASQLLILSTVDLVEFEREYMSNGSYDARAFSAAFRISDPSGAQLTQDGRYIIFAVAFDTAPVVGSFEYRLIQAGKIVSGGCCLIGKYGEQTEVYEVPTVNYDMSIQYQQYD